MRDTSFNFKLGAFDCHVIHDGTIIIPPDQQMELMSLLVRTGGHTVLIDAGEGKGINPTSGYLIENMKAASIDPADIDIVILTHGHLDHVGGLVDDQGRPSYPNARYIMHQKERDYWLPSSQPKSGEKGGSDDLLVATARKKLAAVKDRIDVASDEFEIIPGFKYVLMPGHTPGNTMVVVSSGKTQLLCVGDIVHALDELTYPDKWAQFDNNVEQAARSRNQVLSDTAAIHALLFVCHFPFPGIGYIVKEEGKFIWEPIKK